MPETMMPDPDTMPPQDAQAEQSVLGAAMLSPDALGELTSVLPVEDLYRPAHQAIYRCCLDLYSDGAPVDPVSVAAELEKRGELARIGGSPYLHTLIATVPTATNAVYYADLVTAKAKLRRLGEAGSRIAQLAEFGGTTAAPEVSEVLSRAQYALDQVDGTHTATDVADLDGMVDDTLAYIEDMQTGAADQHIVPTGLADLDAVIGGLRPGQLITVAARPGVGKSALAIQFLRNAAIHHDMPAALFSLEMGKREIITRVASAEAQVRLFDMRRKNGMSDDDWTRLAGKLGEVRAAPLLVDDSPSLTITEIKAKARKLKQRRELRLIVVDYLQLMTSGSRAVENRQQEVAEFSRQLKLLAKELDVPVVALSQLNRGPEQRANKQPMLADLRESGAIEQDSDIVILVSRPDAGERDDPRAGEVDLILAKHRDGPMTTATALHQLHYSRFAGLAREP